MKIASITGELKPKSGYEYDYQIKFDVTTTKSCFTACLMEK